MVQSMIRLALRTWHRGARWTSLSTIHGWDQHIHWWVIVSRRTGRFSGGSSFWDLPAATGLSGKRQVSICQVLLVWASSPAWVHLKCSSSVRRWPPWFVRAASMTRTSRSVSRTSTFTGRRAPWPTDLIQGRGTKHSRARNYKHRSKKHDSQMKMMTATPTLRQQRHNVDTTFVCTVCACGHDHRPRHDHRTSSTGDTGWWICVKLICVDYSGFVCGLNSA